MCSVEILVFCIWSRDQNNFLFINVWTTSFHNQTFEVCFGIAHKKKISIIDKRLLRQQLVEVLDALLEDKVTPSNVAQGAYGKEKIIEGFL